MLEKNDHETKNMDQFLGDTVPFHKPLQHSKT
jgi:hypothetical protein